MRMLVAAHKRAIIPADEMYMPIHVGHALSSEDFGYQPDDQGQNISEKNHSYCELTAVYWAWKNLSTSSIGLAHYRRYFTGSAAGPNNSKVMSTGEAESLLSLADVIISKPRNYYVETIDSHYRNGHVGADIDALRATVAERCPSYIDSFDRVFQGRKLSLYNMFIMRRGPFEEYCNWLFSLLADMEAQISNENRTRYQQRTFGYLGERLLNVWVDAQTAKLNIRTHRVINTEGEPKISKAMGMLRRKFSNSSTHS